MRRVLAATLVLPLFLLAACPDDQEAVRTDPAAPAPNGQAIEQLVQQYEQASRAGDRQALEQMHTGDAWISFAGGPTGGPGEVLGDNPVQLSLDTRRTEVIGEMAYATGSWSQTLQAQDGTTHEIGGHWMASFRHEDGQWRVRDTVTNLTEEAQRTIMQAGLQPGAPGQPGQPGQPGEQPAPPN